MDELDPLLLLDSIGDGVIATDGAGRFTFFNPAARRILGQGGTDATPEQWPTHFGLFLPDRETLCQARALPLLRALNGENTPERELYVRNPASQGDGVFVGVVGSPIRARDGTVVGAVVTFRDITPRVRLREQFERSTALAGLLKAVATAANETASTGHVLHATLAAVCALMRWPLGHAYRCEDEGRLLRSAEAWHVDDAGQFTAFREATALRSYGPGEGIPGSVLSHGKPVWGAELAAQDVDPRLRLAREGGLRAAFAFPILVGEEVVGVLEFFARSPIEPDGQVLDTMGQVGTQLGRVFERERARLREQYFEKIVDHVAHPIFVKDREFRFVTLNQAFCQMLGYRREDMIGKVDHDFFSKEEADFFRQKDVEMFTTRKVVNIGEETATDAAGNRHLLATTKVPLFGSSGEVLYLVGIIHDITRLKQVEEQARKLAVEQAARATAEEAHLRTAFLANASRALATSLDFEATLVKVSHLPLGVLGDWCVVTLVDESHRPRVAAVAHVEPGQERWLRSLLGEALDPGAEARVVRVIHSGQPELIPELDSPRVREMMPAPVRATLSESQLLSMRSYMCVPLVARGRAIGAMSFASTAPGRRFGPEELALAEELAHRVALALDNARLFREAQEAVRLRDEFLLVASHELRTPLTSLKLQVEGLLRSRQPRAAAPPGPEKALDMVRRQVDRLSFLITNLLDVSQLVGGKLQLQYEDVDLTAIARDVIEELSGQLALASCTLRLSADGPVRGRWDDRQLKQVVTNLLSNAVKFGAGGPIELAVEAGGELARLSVADHGIGIASQDVDRIFGRFERAVSARHYGGLGLGLFITRQIVEAHGGSIRVQSQPGSGSIFTVELPRSPPRGEA